MTFALELKEFVNKAKGNAEQVVQKTAIDLLTAIVKRSPVGNPELWERNSGAAEHNAAILEHNANLRNSPDNLTKSGRLKRGLKRKDFKAMSAPEGYVGGRFRGNWQVTFDAPATGETGQIDPKGINTVTTGARVILQFASGKKSIYLVNNVPYAQRLEYGHSRHQAPNGMVRITIAEFHRMINKAARESK